MGARCIHAKSASGHSNSMLLPLSWAMRTPPETGFRAVHDALRAVAAQIGKVGNNLNQVAHGVNVALLSGQAPAPDVAALDGICSALEGLRGEIRQAMLAGAAGPP